MGSTTTEELQRTRAALTQIASLAASIEEAAELGQACLHGANSEVGELKELIISLQHRIDFFEVGAPEVLKDIEFLIDLSARTGKSWIYYTSLNWSSSLPTTLAMVRANNSGGKTQ